MCFVDWLPELEIRCRDRGRVRGIMSAMLAQVRLVVILIVVLKQEASARGRGEQPSLRLRG